MQLPLSDLPPYGAAREGTTFRSCHTLKAVVIEISDTDCYTTWTSAYT
jgi:hypothetical protein